MTGSDLVSAATADLYAADPDTFTERRRELAARARAAGDTQAAKAIAALRKPARAAWVVNLMIRSDPTAAGRLADLAEKLQAGEASLDGAAIRQLSVARRQLIDSLTRQAFEQAGLHNPPSGLRDAVAATLLAALADPQVAAEVAAGTLVRAAQWTGFSPQIGTAAPAPAQGRTAAHETAIERASAALAMAQARADAAAAAARQHEAIAAHLERQLADAISRAKDAQRHAAEATRELLRARQSLAKLKRPDL